MVEEIAVDKEIEKLDKRIPENIVRRLTLRAVAYCYTIISSEPDINQVMFQYLDSTNHGSITTDGLHSLIPKIPEAELKPILKKYMHPRDQEQSRFLVTFSDFLITRPSRSVFCTENALRLAFCLLDSTNSLYLTAKDFCSFADNVGIICDFGEVKKVTQEYYDFIDFSSFCELTTAEEKQSHVISNCQ